MTVEHRFSGVTQGQDGVYIGSCKCGWDVVSQNEIDQPDRQVRKDQAWKAIAAHMVALNPDLKAIVAQQDERAE